jgi:hypothetical protein
LGNAEGRRDFFGATSNEGALDAAAFSSAVAACFAFLPLAIRFLPAPLWQQRNYHDARP